MKTEKRCMVCGRLIPEERYICILCEGVNEMQTFKTKRKPLRYFRIVDDAYMVHYVAVEDGVSVMLAPYTRQADEISKEEYDSAIKERDIK
jgi:predicted nucleic acid-binding Zn ribbon protein